MSKTTRTIIGLDIGGTKTAIVEGTYDGQIVSRHEIHTRAADPFPKTFERLCPIVDRIANQAERSDRVVSALSVSVGGPLRIETGHILDPPHLPGWHDVGLRDVLRDRYPQYPVFVEHDGNAGALAEFHFGAGREFDDVRHLVFLTFGTGLGAGIVVNGQILHGASDTAGEVGHWRLTESGPVGFGKAGSWEGWSSGTAMLELARQKNETRWKDATLRQLVDDMLSDDPDALDLAAETGRWLGRGIALLVDALNPNVIVLGALSAVLGDRIFVPLREELAREALPQAVAACKVMPAVLGSEVGDVAALMAAITRQDDER